MSKEEKAKEKIYKKGHHHKKPAQVQRVTDYDSLTTRFTVADFISFIITDNTQIFNNEVSMCGRRDLLTIILSDIFMAYAKCREM